MTGSCLLHVNTDTNIMGSDFYRTENRRNSSRSTTGDQSKLGGYERFYISITHACEVGDLPS